MPSAHADADTNALIRQLQQQVMQLQETVQQQSVQIRELERNSVYLNPSDGGVKAASETAVPGWLNGLKSKGDLRLRYEIQEFENEDGKDRNRARLRLRWGLEKTFDEEWKAGFRLVSGDEGAATSTNQTFDSEFNFKEIQFDRAYAKWNFQKYASEWISSVKSAEIGGGKVANPFLDWGTEIVWDSDINPEGVYEQLEFSLGQALNAEWGLETQMGQFIVEESGSGNDLELFAYGIGLNRKGDAGDATKVRFAYYDWQDYVDLIKSGSILGAGGTDPETDELKVITLYGEHSHEMVWPIIGSKKTVWFGNWAHNLEEGSQVSKPGNDNAYAAGVKIGKAKKQGEWDTRYQYFYVESNALPSAFVDQDIAYGGTNNTGHMLEYAYMLRDYLKFSTTLYVGERIEDVGGDDLEMLRWQFNLIYGF